jgi:hypothetical protein
MRNLQQGNKQPLVNNVLSKEESILQLTPDGVNGVNYIIPI